jgi:hypothetical protein
MKKAIFLFTILALTFGCVKENVKKEEPKKITTQKKEQPKAAPQATPVKKPAAKNTIKK